MDGCMCAALANCFSKNRNEVVLPAFDVELKVAHAWVYRGQHTDRRMEA